MPATRNPAAARALLEAHIARIAWMRGTGPNPFEYYMWDARTVELLRDVFGADSPELGAYHDAAGIRGRLPGVRGQAENMTLNIHGQWGIRGRLDRAEGVLKGIAAGLQA